MTATNHNYKSPTFDEKKEDREIRENTKIMSIGSRPILPANFHERTFHHMSVFYFFSFLVFYIRCDPVFTERYTFEMPENIHHYNVYTLFLKFLKLLIALCIVPKPDEDSDLDPGPDKKRTPWKNRTSRTKNVVILLK